MHRISTNANRHPARKWGFAAIFLAFSIANTVGAAEPPSAAKEDPTRRAAFTKAVGEVRLAMAGRDYPTARKHLKAATDAAQNFEDRKELARLETVADYLDQFFDGVRDCVAGLGSGEELLVKTTRVAIVEASRTELVIKTAGRMRNWRIEHLPTSLIMATSEKSFTADGPSKVLLGTFLTMDRNGDPDYARRLWQEASRAGYRKHVDQLLPELGSKKATEQIDPIKKKLATLAEMQMKARSLGDHRGLALAALAGVQEAMQAKRRDVAVRMAEIAVAAAKKSRSVSLMRQAVAVQRQVAAAR